MEIKEKRGISLSNPVIMTLIALFCCALWGSATPAIKIGYEKLMVNAVGGVEKPIVERVASIMLFAGIRFFLAGVMTVIIFSIARGKILYPSSKKNVGRILSVSVFQTIIQYIFFYLGLAFTSGVKGTVASGSGAFFSVLIACLIFRQEKLSLKKIIACAVGFFGIVLMNLNGLEFTSDLTDILGVIFVLLSTVSSSFSSVLTKRFSAHEDPVVISGYQFIVGGIFLVIVGLCFGGNITLSDISGVLVLLYLGLLSALAYSLWGMLLKYNSVSRVSVFNFTTPIFGVILSAIFLTESSRVNPWNLAITLVLVSFGILLLNYKPKEKSEIKASDAPSDDE